MFPPFLVLVNTPYLLVCSGQVSEVIAWWEQLCSSTWLLQSPPPPPPPLSLLIFLVLFSNFPFSSTLFLFPPPIFPHHSRSWVNLYCILNKGEIGFYKDAKNTSTPYNNEPLLNLSHCHCDITNGYKKKKNVFTLKWASSLMKTHFKHHCLHCFPTIIAAYVQIHSTILWFQVSTSNHKILNTEALFLAVNAFLNCIKVQLLTCPLY